MNIPTTTHPAPDWLRELTNARTRYEELLGWPVCVEVQPRHVRVPVGAVLDAITMPASLGEQVLTELTVTMQAGPVTAGPNADPWTFLTQPATAPCPGTPADLDRLEVRLLPRGAYANLPTQLDSGNDSAWRWIESPQLCQSLPPWTAVIGATRRVAAALVTSGR
ncbi:MAG: hypothetical protein ACRDRZ_06990 [Pseudonocardiaceae bacterium]